MRLWEVTCESMVAGKRISYIISSDDSESAKAVAMKHATEWHSVRDGKDILVESIGELTNHDGVMMCKVVER